MLKKKTRSKQKQKTQRLALHYISFIFHITFGLKTTHIISPTSETLGHFSTWDKELYISVCSFVKRIT